MIVKKTNKNQLTNDEEADEIIRRLKAPPKPKKTIEELFLETLSAEFAKEIDAEILEELKKHL